MIKLLGPIGYIATIVVFALYSWGLNSRLDLAQSERDTARAIAAGLEEDLDSARAEVTRVNDLLFTLETKEAEIRYVETIVNKEIVKYRDRVVNRCELSSDWVCIANAAASGVPADCGAGQIQN